jgi:Mrp family chromosome partitioning ATPase
MEASRDNLASLTRTVNTIRYGIGDYANKEAMSLALEKEVDVARNEFLAAQGRYNEAKEKVLTDRFSIKQVVRGEPAEKPESRKTIIFMIFSGIISLALCIFVIILLEVADARIRTPKRLTQGTRLNVAGIIPRLPKAIGVLNWNFFFKTEKGVSKEMNSLNHSLRKIRYEVESRNKQVLLVTSTQIGQGKTFFTMAMANSLSLMRKKVLIIDANLRNNSLTRLIAAPTSLRELIDHHHQLSKQLASGPDDGRNHDEKNYYGANLIARTANQFVDIIGSKASPFSPSEVIPGRDFKVLIEWLKSKYDYIILEGAALNEFSDTRELVRFADLIIPVFSADASLTEEDKESIAFLATLSDQLGPAILNNVQHDEK